MTKKYNIIIIFAFLLILSVGLSSLYKYYKTIEGRNEFILEIKEKTCADKTYIGTEYEELCIQANDTKLIEEENWNFFAIFKGFYNEGDVISLFNLSLIIPLLIFGTSLFYVCSYLKNKVIVNEITRKKYKDCIKKLLINAYKPTFILPLITIIAFLISAILSKSFDYKYIENNLSIEVEQFGSLAKYILIYTFGMFVHSVVFINIGLIISRKYHNYFVSVVLSFLAFVGLECILELLFGSIIMGRIFDNGSGILIFTIINYVNPNYNVGYFVALIVPLSIAILSTILVLLLYKNKEKLIIDCEKNEVEEGK